MQAPALKINHTSFITWAVRRGLPYLDCEAANREIVRLNVENLCLRAEIDAMKLAKEAE